MSFLALVVLVAAFVPLVTRGSYRRLADAPWRWGGLLALGLALQLLLDTSLIPRSSWHSVGFGILVASYVLLVGFCAGNMIVRGMAVVLIGVALNAFVVTIDQGMPVHIPPDWQRTSDQVSATVKHHPRVAGDHLLVLTDIIVLRRLDAVVSFGDLIIAFGLVDATYWASRRSRRTRPLAPAPPTTGPPLDRESIDSPAEPREPVSAGVGDRSSGSRVARERQHARVGARRGSSWARSGARESTVAIQDALERLERS